MQTNFISKLTRTFFIEPSFGASGVWPPIKSSSMSPARRPHHWRVAGRKLFDETWSAVFSSASCRPSVMLPLCGPWGVGLASAAAAECPRLLPSRAQHRAAIPRKRVSASKRPLGGVISSVSYLPDHRPWAECFVKGAVFARSVPPAQAQAVCRTARPLRLPSSGMCQMWPDEGARRPRGSPGGSDGVCG